MTSDASVAGPVAHSHGSTCDAATPDHAHPGSSSLITDMLQLPHDFADVSSTAEAAVALICRHLHGVQAYVVRHDPGGAVILARSTTTLDELYVLPPRVTPWTLEPGGRATIRDTRDDDRFHAFCRRLDDHGVRSMHSIGLPVLRTRPVTLDIYSTEPDAFATCSDRNNVIGYFGFAMQALDAIDTLRQGMESRATVAQAQGIYMERFALTPDEAMALLRRQSQHSNRKLRDIAHQVAQDRASVRPQRAAGEAGP